MNLIGNKLILAFVLFAFITLRLTTAPHPTGEYSCWFEIPNVIIVYNVDEMTAEEYNKCVVHESVHYLAWILWKINPYESERFFN